MERNTKALINWSYHGKPDFFIGTGATNSEKILALGAGLASVALLYGLAWRHQPLEWVWWQWVLALVLVVDIAGGVVSNALNSQKRYTHAPPQPEETGTYRFLKRYPIAFMIVHLHPFIVAGAFGGTLVFALVWYFGTLAAYVLVSQSPLYLQRPIAFVLIAVSIVVNEYAIPSPLGFEWFAPFFVIKLVYGHAVREEPYRPVAGGTLRCDPWQSNDTGHLRRCVSVMCQNLCRGLERAATNTVQLMRQHHGDATVRARTPGIVPGISVLRQARTLE